MTTFLNWFLEIGKQLPRTRYHSGIPALVSLHAASDLLIGIAYLAIWWTLWNFVRKARKDIRFHWCFFVFGAFIIACGATHLIEVWTIWTPAYWASGTIKALTAVASVITAIALRPVLPISLKLVSAAHLSGERKLNLEKVNGELRAEIAERAKAEADVRHLNLELALLIRERTSELAVSDSDLNATIQKLDTSEQRFEQLGENSFHLIANSIPQMAWIADKDGWIYWFNQRWYTYTGTTLQQMQGWGWQNVLEPNHLHSMLDGWRGAINAGEPFGSESLLRGAAGQFRRFITRVVPLKDRDGVVTQWVGTHTDVATLRNSEACLRLLYDSEMVGIFYWSPSGAITDANDAFLKIVGYPRSDLLAGKLNWVSMTPPEWLPQNELAHKELEQSGTFVRTEKEYFRKDGSRVSVEIGGATYGALDNNGVAFILDITKRKQAETDLADLNQTLEQRVQERLAELAQAYKSLNTSNEELVKTSQNLAGSRAFFKAVLNGATGVAIVSTDPRGIITEFNSGAEQMLQYRADEVTGIHTPMLFHLEAECTEAEAALSMELGRPISGFNILAEPVRLGNLQDREWLYVRKDLTTLNVRLSTTAVRDECGLVTGFVVIALDITARKALETELRERNSLLEQGVQDRTEKLQSALVEKTVLLKEVHHRVKNNLAVVVSLLGMQADASAHKDATLSLLESQRRVHSMALIHEHLYGTKNLGRVRFDEYANKLATELCIAFASPIRISVHVQAEPLELTIEKAIPCGLVLNELITNAFKYAFPEPRGGAIWVNFGKSEPGLLTLEVKDDGIGLPPGLDIPHARTLGLKIIYILATQLNAHIKFQGHSGTDFKMTFPVHEDVEASHPKVAVATISD